MLESKFKTQLCKDIKADNPGAEIYHLTGKQGQPDLLIICGKKWAMLEGKQDDKSKKQPNQEYYVDKFDKMSFARFIDKTNRDEVVGELNEFFSVQ